jgi:ankyrin repeat protein
METYLKDGVNPDREKNSPLLFQLMTDSTDPEVIRLLLHYGANPNGRFFEYGCRRDTIKTIIQKCLEISYKHNKTDLIELLLKYNANANQELSDLQDGRNHTRETKWFIIHEVVLRPTFLKVFLDAGAKVNVYYTDLFQREKTEYTAETPLHKACKQGNYDSTLLLLLHGADPNAGGEGKNSKFTPLHISLLNKHYDLTSLLITFNADPSLPYLKDSKSPPQTASQLCDNNPDLLLHLQRRPLALTKKVFSYLPTRTKESIMIWLLVLQRLNLNWPKDISHFIIHYLIIPDRITPLQAPRSRGSWI